MHVGFRLKIQCQDRERALTVDDVVDAILAGPFTEILKS
jgi:hypothetical protein